MKKVLSQLSVVALLCSCQMAMADDTCVTRGSSLVCDNGAVSSIHNTGSVRLNGTQVDGDVIVTGSFKAFSAKLHDTSVTGSTELNGSSVDGYLGVTGKTKVSDSELNKAVRITGNFSSSGDKFHDHISVTGQFNAEQSQFDADIDVTAKEVQLSKVEAKNIIVHKSGAAKAKQSLYLRDGTHVAGNISFDGNNGLVFVTDGASIDGEVIGAEVFHSVKD